MKKESLTLAAAILFTTANLAPAATNDLSSALQRGLFEEEANHNLDAAIAAYQSVATQFDKDRKLAATAIFRLGEVYRKQGKTNEANAQYERVVREFADQQTLVELARTYLRDKVVATADAQRTLPEIPSGSTDEEEKEIRRIKAMIKDSPDLINAQTTALTEGENPERGTPLHKAASLGQLIVAEFLLANGADTELKSAFSGNTTPGHTALNLAARNGHKAMVELLLSKGANIQAVGYWGSTSLHFAASRGYKAVVEVLLKNKADINAKNNDNDTPLHLAVAKGYRPVVELLLSHNADVNAKNNKGFTPLFLAIENKNIELAKLLIANKADVKLAADKSSVAGWTPLHKAVEMGDARLIELLLQNGAKLELKVAQYQYENGSTEKNLTPLHIAVAKGKPEIVELLLKNGANPNSTNSSGATPLFYAVTSQNKQIVELLLAQKADVNAKDSSGYAPLHKVMWPNNIEIARLLINHGAELNSKSKDGYTPLHLAVNGRQINMVELLLTNKADPNIQNNSGRTPLREIKSSGSDSTTVDGRNVTKQEIIDLLEKYGANENVERLSRISVSRGSGMPSEPVYFRGKSPDNLPGAGVLTYQWKKDGGLLNPGGEPIGALTSASHYSLFELLARLTYPFPELSKIKINRLDPATQKTRDILVNLEEILKSGDCSKDVWLEWGDIIEIPETDHLVNASWSGFPKEYMEMVQKCLERKVSIAVKGETTNLTLRASVFNTAIFANGQPATDSWRISVPAQFYLNQLLIPYLRASSDKTRIRVKRNDPVTKKAQEIIINLEKGEDLWLRDGDVIEIPERDPNASPAASDNSQGGLRTIQTQTLRLPSSPNSPVPPN